MLPQTELAVYESVINLPLLNDIIAFVRDTSKADSSKRTVLRRSCIFLDHDANGSAFQEKYGFLYLGELLERYEERFGMSIQDFRAIALALGYTRDMADDSMFIGPQRRNFLRQLMSKAKDGDVYANALGDWQREAFFRVVKAELMGKLDELKYFEGDLQRELDFPLTMPVKMGWRRNLGIAKCGLEVREHDGFFSTMLLGVQPQRTCLSYIDGQYRECLLSAFDSNKKILYATLDGKVVGRAFLRLTKGRLTGSGNQSSSFTFVDLEDTTAPRNEGISHREQVTLFLERPYISGVGPEEEAKIQAAFVDLAAQKADEMDVMLVLSQDYRSNRGTGFVQTSYDIYISKSKAGKQYLDSLDGEAAVTKEGSYKANTFLVRGVGGLSCACNE